MLRKILWVTCFLFFSQSVLAVLPVPKNLVAFDSYQGKNLLSRNITPDYLKLSMQFLTQKNQAYCGVASMTMVLNAMEMTGPIEPVYAPFRPITQDNFFRDAVKNIATPEQVAHHGLTLDQLGMIAAQFPVTVQTIHANSLTLSKMRQLLISTLNTKEYAIINFFRPGLKETGSGHFSPIAAYDAKTDRFLILDVARYKYPPVWATAADIWQAINTTDSDSQKTRGILIIQSSTSAIR